MKTTLENVRLSYQGLKDLRTLTTTALLVALGVILGFFTIAPNEMLKIGLGFVATSVMGFLFGPIPALLGASAVDIISYLIRPTGPYFFGFTLDKALSGIIYGLLLYRKPIRLWRAFAAKGLVSLIVNCMLATYWLSILYGKSISVLLPARVIKNAIALPFEAAALWLLLLGVQKAWARVSRR
ncbi:MAG: folate family ECF transporter S component [Provencibacterium sp.]|jgi:ECF transporter S component (folate family)|nr:folate family ECF transporter S component [Provencibacterium sp.]